MNKKEKADIIARFCNDILLHNKQVPTPELSGSDWDEVLEMSSSQGVLPIVLQKLNEANPKGGTPMVKEQLLQWIGVTLQNEQNYKLRLYVMRELAAIFGKEGIDIMFLKGASLAQLYPNPEWRVFSDVDYYLYGDSEKGIKLLAEQGIQNSDYYHHHTQASFNGVLIENHYDFVERINHKCDVVLDDALKELATREGHAVKAEFLEEDLKNAYLMTPTMNAIFLMRHMSAHFVSETVPLRMLYDWALFLKKYAREVDWENVVPLYEKSGMIKFVGIVMTILKNHLEFECPACPVSLGNQAMADRVWGSIINPPKPDPHDKFTLRYYLFEAQTFFANRWKHKLVYPGESFVGLFFKYVKLGLNMMIKRH
ncbi:MAG: nucleotidyltransferase family protein [Acetivibrionales bacterium]|jgi:hypothetical protein